MEQRILSIEIRAVSKAVDRYLGESMPLSAKGTTGGNAHIIMFLARNRDREIYQHTIEQKFCITRSTASRVLALMEKNGLIARESVAHDARCKRIVLTDKADAIVADLKANGERVERLLVEAVEWCKSRGLEFYAVNKDYPEEQKGHQGFSRKLKADMFIDDRNLGGLPDWGVIYEMIKEKKTFADIYSQNGEEEKTSLKKKKRWLPF